MTPMTLSRENASIIANGIVIGTAPESNWAEVDMVLADAMDPESIDELVAAISEEEGREATRGDAELMIFSSMLDELNEVADLDDEALARAEAALRA